MLNFIFINRYKIGVALIFAGVGGITIGVIIAHFAGFPEGEVIDYFNWMPRGWLMQTIGQLIAFGAGQDVSDLNKLIKMHRQMSDMMKKIGRKGGKGMLRNLLGDLTGSGNDKEGIEKILEKNPNLSRQLSSQLNQNNFSSMMGNIPGFMKKK